jgi:hypothetical protein
LSTPSTAQRGTLFLVGVIADSFDPHLVFAPAPL